jgi:hypothetical protein
MTEERETEHDIFGRRDVAGMEGTGEAALDESGVASGAASGAAGTRASGEAGDTGEADAARAATGGPSVAGVAASVADVVTTGHEDPTDRAGDDLDDEASDGAIR